MAPAEVVIYVPPAIVKVLPCSIVCGVPPSPARVKSDIVPVVYVPNVPSPNTTSVAKPCHSNAKVPDVVTGVLVASTANAVELSIDNPTEVTVPEPALIYVAN